MDEVYVPQRRSPQVPWTARDMNISPYFSQSARFPQFDDFGITSLTQSLIIDEWLERAEDSDPLPPPLTVGRPVVTMTDVQPQESGIRVTHAEAFSNTTQSRQSFDNSSSLLLPFTDKTASLRPIDSDASLSPPSEYLATPTPVSRLKVPRFTSINSDVQLSPSAPPPVVARECLVTRISSPQDRDASRPSSIDLVPTSILPDHLRPLFPFQYFNAMQSQSLRAIYSSDHNIVLSAPTGSGKTTCFELAIARTMNSMEFSVNNFKVFVLQSPYANLLRWFI